jgi:terminase large subunit-like protein
MNTSRQSGKSTIAALKALHMALTRAGSLILLISPSLRQSGELFRKVTDFFARLPARPRLVEDTRLSLQCGNNSRIVSLPSSEATICGFSSVTLVIEDEASRVADDLYFATRPMLAVSGGAHILMSTPYGPRGHFYEAWEHGGAEWERVCVPASDCPRIPAAFLEAERRSMPQRWYDSEYNCLFVDVDGAVFRHEDLLAALSSDVAPLFACARVPPSQGGPEGMGGGPDADQ